MSNYTPIIEQNSRHNPLKKNQIPHFTGCNRFQVLFTLDYLRNSA